MNREVVRGCFLYLVPYSRLIYNAIQLDIFSAIQQELKRRLREYCWKWTGISYRDTVQVKFSATLQVEKIGKKLRDKGQGFMFIAIVQCHIVGLSLQPQCRIQLVPHSRIVSRIFYLFQHHIFLVPHCRLFFSPTFWFFCLFFVFAVILNGFTI